MNFFLSHFLSLLLFSIVYIQLTSSASFPNPPPIPSASASPDEWAHFWKLLHNYYAIIARPRFGKRSELNMASYRPSSLLAIVKSNYASSWPSPDNEIDYALSESTHNANGDRRYGLDDFDTLVYPDRQRRR